jgi:hypothetical protein
MGGGFRKESLGMQTSEKAGGGVLSKARKARVCYIFFEVKTSLGALHSFYSRAVN